VALSDDDLLGKMRNAANGDRFASLYDMGYIGDYDDDHSRADSALCCLLAFWTGWDAPRMDTLFRASALRRDKWDERRGAQTYGERTIAFAIGVTPDYYLPPPSPEDDAPSLNGAREDAKREESEESPVEGDSSHTSHFAASQEETEQEEETAEDKEEEEGREPPQPLRAEAYVGLAGEVVEAVKPHTEADPAGILVEVLALFGALVGRATYFQVSGTRHYPNLFVTLVGATAKSRKGVSWGAARYVFSLIPGLADWLSTNVVGGLSSGEGLIHALADYSERDASDDKKKLPLPTQTDKRVVVNESEFSSVLRMPAREGNTLSEVVRRAWDGDILQTLTKSAPERATSAHVAVVGNITPEDLVRYVSESDRANGLGNRFLWVYVKRNGHLPDGGDLPSVKALPVLARKIERTLKWAQALANKRHVMTRDPKARELWHRQYPRLSEGYPGMCGAMTARGEAQVMRLACVYALLGQSEVVREVDLEAALAIWDYCENSVRFIFGDILGDPIADALLRALRDAPEGLTRWQINDDVFSRHVKSNKIATALDLLRKHRLARREVSKDTGGRPVERWYAILGTK
jgi:primase/DNA polymerase family protein